MGGFRKVGVGILVNVCTEYNRRTSCSCSMRFGGVCAGMERSQAVHRGGVGERLRRSGEEGGQKCAQAADGPTRLETQ